MPSFLSMLTGEQIRLIKPLLSRMSIHQSRALQDMLGDLEAKFVAERVAFEPVPMEGFEACFALPQCEKDNRSVILYLHGGAFVAGNLKYARGFAGILADRTQRRVLSAAYRLAPEHPFPAALNDAFHRSFWWAIGFTGVGFLVSLALPGAVQEASPEGAAGDRMLVRS